MRTCGRNARAQRAWRRARARVRLRRRATAVRVAAGRGGARRPRAVADRCRCARGAGLGRRRAHCRYRRGSQLDHARPVLDVGEPRSRAAAADRHRRRALGRRCLDHVSVISRAPRRRALDSDRLRVAPQRRRKRRIARGHRPRAGRRRAAPIRAESRGGDRAHRTRARAACLGALRPGLPQGHQRQPVPAGRTAARARR